MSNDTKPPDTGGPAFPVNGTSYYGMTLLDWYAGKVLEGMIPRHDVHHLNYDATAIAEFCFDQAKAMLAVRERIS